MSCDFFVAASHLSEAIRTRCSAVDEEAILVLHVPAAALRLLSDLNGQRGGEVHVYVVVEYRC